MKKSVRNILILVLVLAVLGGAALALVNLPSDEEEDTSSSSSESSSDTGEELFSHTADDVDKIVVKNAEGEFELLPEEEGSSFTLSGYEEYDLNKSSISSAARCFFSAKTVRELGEQENLESFGLAGGEECRVSISFADGSQDDAVIGNEAAESNGRYALIDGKVYILSGIAANLFGKATDFFNTSLYSIGTRQLDPGESEPAAGETVSDRLYEMTLSGTHFEQDIQIEYDEDSFGYHTITAPVKAESGNEALTDLIESLKELTVTGVEAVGLSGEVLEKYGLAEPFAKVDFNLNDVEHMISVSESHSGTRYLLLDDRDVVYTVSQSAVSPWAETDLDLLRMTYVFVTNIEDVQALTIETPERVYAYSATRTVDEERSTDTHTAYDLKVKNSEGKELVYENYQHSYSRVMGIAILSSEKAEYDRDKKVFSAKYEYFGGGSDEVEFFDAGEDRYAVEFNGKYNGIVRASEVNSVIGYIEDLEEGKTVPGLFG